MTVFDQATMLANIEIFIAKKAPVAESAEEKDPLDDLIEEQEEETDEGLPGLLPESIQSTQAKPTHSL